MEEEEVGEAIVEDPMEEEEEEVLVTEAPVDLEVVEEATVDLAVIMQVEIVEAIEEDGKMTVTKGRFLLDQMLKCYIHHM